VSKHGFVDRRNVLERRNVDLSTVAVYPKAETSEKRQRLQSSSANLLIDIYIYISIYICGINCRVDHEL